MTTTVGTLSKGKLKVRELESTAFYYGAHGINPAPTEQEIDDRITQETSDEKREPLLRLHDLETKRDQARRGRPESEELWERVKNELGDTPPPCFHALVMAIFALFALALDTLFLAPTMDILNIAGEVLQYLAAVGMAALSTAWFEMAAIIYMDAKGSVPKRAIAIAAAVAGALSLVVWGLLRGFELRFAAGLAGNPLGQFLAAHPVLASCFYIFITLATPIVGAAALRYGWADFWRANIWRRTRKKFETLRAEEIRLARAVETEIERIAHIDARRQAQRREMKAIFQQFYERGQRNGASRETLWSVIWKTAVCAFLASPLALFVPWVWFPAQLTVPAIAAMGFFTYFNHHRHHPSHERYLAAENTRFAVVRDGAPLPDSPTPSQHLLAKGDPQ